MKYTFSDSLYFSANKLKETQLFMYLNKLISFVFIFIISSFMFSTLSLASGGKVEALKMPAWLVRGGIQSPLTPGMILQSGDKLKTGSESKLLLVMDEGSLIKLGENAEFNFDALIPAEEEQGFFEATLNVVKGAFRFTTTALGQSRKRQIEVRIGSITVGIRGTDIWGSSTGEKDTLCLIEGNITAQRAGEPEFAMNDPLSFYIVPKNKPALPVSPVPEAKLMKWASETELRDGSGVMSISGRWAVNLISVVKKDKVSSILDSLTNAGYAAEIQTALVKGTTWYRLRVNGFKSREDAKAFSTEIKGTNGITTSWIIKFLDE